MLYNAGIRALGEESYREEGECEQHQFVHWIKTCGLDWQKNK